MKVADVLLRTKNQMLIDLVSRLEKSGKISIKKRFYPQKKYEGAIFYDDSFIKKDIKKVEKNLEIISTIKNANPSSKCIVFTHPDLRTEYLAKGAAHCPEWFLDENLLIKEIEKFILDPVASGPRLNGHRVEMGYVVDGAFAHDLETLCEDCLVLGFNAARIHWKIKGKRQWTCIYSNDELGIIKEPDVQTLIKKIRSSEQAILPFDLKLNPIDLDTVIEGDALFVVFPLKSDREELGCMILIWPEKQKINKAVCRHIQHCVESISSKHELVLKNKSYELSINDGMSHFARWIQECELFPSVGSISRIKQYVTRTFSIFNKLISQSPIGVIHIIDGKIVFFNKITEAITGYKPEIDYGMHIKDWHATVDQARKIKKALAQRKYFQDRVDIIKADKTIKPNRLTAFQTDNHNVFAFFEGVDREDRANRRTKALLGTSTTLIEAKDSQKGLDDLAAKVVQFLDCTYCHIILYEEEQQKYIIKAAKARKGVQWRSWRHRSFSPEYWPPFSQLLSSGKPVLFQNDKKSEINFHFISNLSRLQEPLNALMLAPLHFEGHFLGFISVGEQRILEQTALEENLDVIEAIAAQLSIWLQQTRVSEVVELERRHLEACFKASNALVSVSSPEKTMSDIVTKIAETTRAWQVSMISIDKLGGVRASLNKCGSSKINPGDAIQPDGVTMGVLGTGEPKIFNRLSEFPNPPAAMIEEGIQSAACFPMSLQNERIGAVWIFFKQLNIFRDSEIKALQLFVNQSAIAYDYAVQLAAQKRLREAIHLLNKTDETKKIRPLITKAVKLALEADDASLWLFDKPTGKFFKELELIRPAEKRRQILDGISTPFVKYLIKVQEQGWACIEDSSRFGFDELIAPKSLQATTMEVGGKEQGILVAAYQNSRSFGPEDRERALSFAQHVASSLAQTDLVERLGKARKTSMIVAKVSLSEDFQKTLGTIAQKLKELLQCHTVTIMLYDRETNRITHPPIMVGNNKERPPKTGVVKKNGLVDRVLNLKTIYWSNDLKNDRIFKNSKFVKDEGIQSCLATPLEAEGKTVGLMFVNYRHPLQFEERELEDIELFAYQAAGAIQGARLYDQAQLQLRGLLALHKAGKEIVSLKNIEEIYRTIAETAWQLAKDVAGKEGRVHVCIKNDATYKVVATIPKKDEHRVGTIIPLDKSTPQTRGIVGRCIMKGKSQLVDDVSKDPDYINYFDSGSQLAVPMKDEQKIIGAVNIEHPEKYAFNYQHQLLLESLASQAGIAIRYAEDYQKLRDLKGFVGSRTAIEWMRMTNYTWAHTIRREVGTAWTNLELIRRYIPNPAPEVMETIDEMERALVQIKNVQILEPLGSEDQTEQIEINGLLRTYLKRRWAHEGYKDLAHDFTPDSKLDKFRVVASKNWLRRGFEIIIENAVRAMRQWPERENVLTVETRLEQDKFVTITVSDTGKGLPKAVLDKIFESQIEKEDGAHGAGIGLMQAGTIFQCYDGVITARNKSNPKGAEFTIKLPVVSNSETDRGLEQKSNK